MKNESAFEELLSGSGLAVPTEQLLTDLDEIIINADNIDFSKMSNLTYIHCKHFDIQGEYKISKILVSKLKRAKYADLFLKMQKYDPTTYFHSIRVAYLATALGIELGYSKKDLEILAEGALLHDAGKMLLPEHILKKNGKLTRKEYAIVKNHPEYGIEYLDQMGIKTSKAIKKVIKQHHENFDGSGYPLGLQDFNIDKNARIVHIVDVYDALCTKRPYKKELDRRAVWILMDNGSAVDFDPLIYAKFKRIMPVYLLGEEVTRKGKTARVIGVNIEDKWNPLLYYEGTVQFYNEVFA